MFGSGAATVLQVVSESLNRTIVESSSDAILLTDLRGTIIHCNGVAAVRFGVLHMPDKVNIIDLLSDGRTGTAAKCLAEARRGLPARMTLSKNEHDNETRWWDVIASPVQGPSEVDRIVFVARDVTELQKAHLHAEWLSDHDALTGLPNRTVLQSRLLREIAAARVAGTRIAVLIIDVDDFKQVNDAHGHPAGDMMLQAFASRLRSQAKIIQAARIGGDEFAAILGGISVVGDAAEVAQSLATGIAGSLVYEGATLDCRASIGVAIYPDHAEDADLLVRNADMALYAAKTVGRGGFAIYSAGMRIGLATRARQIEVARSALRLNAIEPAYQPKIDLETGKIIGFEALLRYRNAAGQVVAPSTVEAALNDPELGVALGERMQDLVFSDLLKWEKDRIPVGTIAINASVAEFRSDTFSQRFIDKLEYCGVRPDRIELEVIETVFLGRRAGAIERMLQHLSQVGVRVALDDFGTGYASLAHLNDFPISTIKIDRSFIATIENRERSSEIVKAIVTLAKALRLTMVAEGIETVAQGQFAYDTGCSIGQGYLFGAPRPRRIGADAADAA